MSTGEVSLIAIDALDKLSRYRALSDVESFNLERLIRYQEQSPVGAQRVSTWRRIGLIMAMHIPDGESPPTDAFDEPVKPERRSARHG